ncbi:MAG: sugar nucleotide-binding protein [Gammaproteobacteria bacterium]|nr:sugar nucleotide-binding protein [Gammaproteobacteria bacterium]MDD9897055.1 sugar nucleotide-binding protein [Gammaproteobacteria bacterium]MDD9959777.1 sugar nucleotide-binding protein [Gammaproteobacteria bacterium]
MKLFIVGGNSPTAKDLIEVLRKRRIRFQAPPDYHFDPGDPVGIAKLVTDAEPTQLINLADFISTNHSALRRAETTEDRCYQINSRLPAVLAEICNHLNVPIMHLSNAYVFDGTKKLGYNENDETNPQGVYGLASLQGERAVRQHNNHIVIRSGWLFGKKKKGLIKSWIRATKRDGGRVAATSRRLSPTYTGHLAQAILAVIQQVDCEANVWGTYHYSGLETKRESEFVEQVIKYAANHDEGIYQLLDSINVIEQDVHAPEIFNSTLSSKKIFDTFGIKQKSWHGNLQEVIKTLYKGVYRTGSSAPENESTESDAA